LTPRAKSASGGPGKKKREKLKSRKQLDAEIEEGKEAPDPFLTEMDSNLSSDSPSEQIASLTANSASANSATLSPESMNIDGQADQTSPSETVVPGSVPNIAASFPILQNVSPANSAANSEEAVPLTNQSQINSSDSYMEQIEIAAIHESTTIDFQQNSTLALFDVRQLPSTDTIEQSVTQARASSAFVCQAPQLLVPVVCVPQLRIPNSESSFETGNSPIEENSASTNEKGKDAAETSPILATAAAEIIDECDVDQHEPNQGCQADLNTLFGSSDDDDISETRMFRSLTPRAQRKSLALSGDFGG